MRVAGAARAAGAMRTAATALLIVLSLMAGAAPRLELHAQSLDTAAVAAYVEANQHQIVGELVEFLRLPNVAGYFTAVVLASRGS